VEAKFWVTLPLRVTKANLKKTICSLMIMAAKPTYWHKIIDDSSRRPSQTLGNAKLIVLIKASPFALLWTIGMEHATD